ncbi:MAG: ectoine/hydroxyectoine ABC transporter permease subunit EhuD [Pelagibacterium sp. SCN 64-44]|nr:MAG: ectoine/hydroxyectoine ABC transporter permease subunit EhuD [Pelagibacterium sp. SCN 64-44]
MSAWKWDYAFSILPTLLKGVWVTIQLTALSLALALAMGLLLAIARMSPIKAVSRAAGMFIEFVRSTPLLIQLYFIYYVGPEFGLVLSPFLTGIIGLGLHYSAYTAEVYRAGIANVQQGQWEAARSLNLGTFATWRDIILPQAVAAVVAPLGNYALSMFKETPILIGISVVELLGEAQKLSSTTYRYLEPLTIAGLFFFALSYPTSKLIRYIDRRISKS